MEGSNSSSCTIVPENTTTLSANRQTALKKLPETSHNSAEGQDHSAADFRPRRRRAHVKKISKYACNGGGEELTDEKAEVEKKIEALQKIVPGGERLEVAELFEETAEYISELEWQVKALRFLAAFVQSSEKKKRMLGG